jgi:hypothetical protein
MHFKKIKKLLLISVCALISVIALSRFCHTQTAGFRVAKIRCNLMDTIAITNPPPKDTEFLNALFQQKFTYLGRGQQSFVFASEDGQYVLKVFNNRYQEKISLFSLLSHLPWMDHWAQERATYYQGKLAKTFNSYQLAFNEMKEQTGLIYAHLFPSSNIQSALVLTDKLNISHSLDANQLGFLVQKRATLVYPALKEYLYRRDLEGAKQTISSLVNLFFWKWQHSIADNDPLIRTNYGVIRGKVIQIDVGPLSKEMGPPLPAEEHRQEILHITASLKNWLTKNGPELIPYLDQELQQQLSSRHD